MKKGLWHSRTILSILSNEKYKGDAILNKTYITDCISRKVKVNNGERPKYYVENNHPAIIDSDTFGKVQEEMARRSSKPKIKQVGTKTERGRYCSKYALSELLICGECGTPYRRCSRKRNDEKVIEWRCISRLDYGRKYCHNSPTMEESALKSAIMDTILKMAIQNAELLKNLKLHIGTSLKMDESENKRFDIQLRLAEINAEFKSLLKEVASNIASDTFDDTKMSELMNEKHQLEEELERYEDSKQKQEKNQIRLGDIFTVVDGLKNHPLTYDERIIRQILECVVVESKNKIKVVFVGGAEVEQDVN